MYSSHHLVKKALFGLLAIVGMGAFSQLAAENEISIYGTAPIICDQKMGESMQKFPSWDLSYAPSGAYGFGARYVYWTERKIGFAIDYQNYGYNGDPRPETLKLESYTAMGLYQLQNFSVFEPYIGGGLGVRTIAQTAEHEGMKYMADYEPVLSVSGVGGAHYRFTKNLSIFAEFRADYAGVSQTTSGSEVSGEFPWLLSKAVNFGVSLRY